MGHSEKAKTVAKSTAEGDESPSLDLLTKTIVGIQKEIDKKVDQGGKVHIHSIFNASICATELDIAPVLEAKQMKFADIAHKSRYIENLVLLLLDRINTLSLLTRIHCNQRIHALTASDYTLPTVLTPKPRGSLAQSYNFLNQACEAEADLIETLVEKESSLQYQLGEMAMSKSSKAEEVEMLKEIIQKSDPDSGLSRTSTTESREQERQRLKAWHTLFQEISLAAERRILCLDADHAPCVSVERQNAQTQTTATSTSEQTSIDPRLIIFELKQSIHWTLSLVFSLGLDKLLEENFRKEGDELLSSTPNNCDQTAITSISYIKEVIKICSSELEAEKEKRQHAIQEKESALLRAKRTDDLVKAAKVEVTEKFNEKIKSLNEEHEETLARLMASHTSELQSTVATCEKLKSASTELEAVLEEKAKHLKETKKALDVTEKSLRKKVEKVELLERNIKEEKEKAKAASKLKKEIKELNQTLSEISKANELLENTSTMQQQELDSISQSKEKDMQELEETYEKKYNLQAQKHKDREQSLIQELNQSKQTMIMNEQQHSEKLQELSASLSDLTTDGHEKDDLISKLQIEVNQLRAKEKEVEGIVVSSTQNTVLEADNKRLKRELEHYRVQASKTMQQVDNAEARAAAMTKECEEWKEKCAFLEHQLANKTDTPNVVNPFELFEPTAMWMDDDIPSVKSPKPQSPQKSRVASLLDPRGKQSPSPTRQSPSSYDMMRVHSAQRKRRPSTARQQHHQESADDDLFQRPPSRLSTRPPTSSTTSKQTTAHPPQASFHQQRPTSSSLEKPMSTEEAYMRIMRKYKQRSAKGHHGGNRPHPIQHHPQSQTTSSSRPQSSSIKHPIERPPSSYSNSTRNEQKLGSSKFMNRYLK